MIYRQQNPPSFATCHRNKRLPQQLRQTPRLESDKARDRASSRETTPTLSPLSPPHQVNPRGAGPLRSQDRRSGCPGISGRASVPYFRGQELSSCVIVHPRPFLPSFASRITWMMFL